MYFQNLETYRGLIKPADKDELGALRKSCSNKIFEDSTHFTKVVLNNLKIDTEEYCETEVYPVLVSEYMTVYVSTNLSLKAKDKIKVTHKLFLLNPAYSKDDKILSTQTLILICKDIDKPLKTYRKQQIPRKSIKNLKKN